MAMRFHRVRAGETLASIAEDYYGDQRLFAYIYQHNRAYIENPNVLAIGQSILIPHMPLTDSIADTITKVINA